MYVRGGESTARMEVMDLWLTDLDRPYWFHQNLIPLYDIRNVVL